MVFQGDQFKQEKFIAATQAVTMDGQGRYTVPDPYVGN
jgi:hypothetical protein